VDGIEFASNSAGIIIDDTAGNADTALQAGMVVKVQGTINSDNRTGIAGTIRYTPQLRGPVDATPSISGQSGTFTIFNQPVVVDATTTYNNTQGLTDITPLMIVEVSGFFDSTGLLHATRVIKTPPRAGFVMTGNATNVTPTTFSIGGITVNYAASTRTNFPIGGLTNGVLVRIKTGTLPSFGLVTATSVEALTGGVTNVNNGQQVRVEGLVSDMSGNRFDVAGQSVATTSTTIYEGGTLATLSNNDRIDAEGTINNGLLTATKVRITSAPDVVLQAQVTQINTTGGTVTVFGASGITIQLDRYALFEDQSNANLHSFGINTLSTLQYVSVAGKKNGPNTMTGTRLTRINPNTQISLTGALDSAALPTLVILGVRAETNFAGPFKDSNGNTITQVQFFDQATAGTIVKVDGTFSGSSITVTQAKIGS